MKEKKEVILTIPFNKAKEILRLDSRTLRNFIALAQISIINRSDALSDILINKGDLCSSLGLKELPDKFLTITEASEEIGVSWKQMSYFCRMKLVPFYRLKEARGSKYLFIKEELAASQIKIFELEKSIDPKLTLWRCENFQAIVSRFVDEAKSIDLLDERDYDIVRSVLFGKEDMDDIAIRHDLSKERVRQIFEKNSRRLPCNISLLYSSLKEVEKENDNLRRKNVELEERFRCLEASVYNAKKEEEGQKEVIPNFTDLLETSLNDFGFSVRTRNCLKYYGVKTVGDLLLCKESALEKIRGFGYTSLCDTREVLSRYNLKLEK